MLAFFALLLSLNGYGQVKLNLSYQPDTKIYTVSILPEVSWPAPKNMLASAQIVLKVPAGVNFTPGISSMVDGLVWADNAYIDNPGGAPGFSFVCIALVNGPTSKIEFTEGKEIPLFSFKNISDECVGLLELLSNQDPLVLAVRAGGLNITQHLAVLGARGNAVSGIANGSVDCSPASGVGELPEKLIEEVRISPVPADKMVTIQWTLLTEGNEYQQIVLCDAQGREVYRDKISNGKGLHSLQLPVANWKAGLYRMRFVSDKGHQTQAWNLMVVH